MPEDEVAKLAVWLAEARSRPALVEVVVAAYDLVEPIGDGPSTAWLLVRLDST